MSHVPPEDSQEPTEQTPDAKPQGRLARWFGRMRGVVAWIGASRFRMAMTAGAALAALGGVLTLWLALALPEPPPPQLTADMALEALDRGEYAEARQLARRLAARPAPPDEPAGIAEYILGAAAANEAGKASRTGVSPVAKKDLYLLAARHLREACTQGLPEDRLADGLRLLGKSLLSAGEVADSQRALEEALKIDHERTSEICWLMAAACMQDAEPKLPAALEHNAKCLADPRLSPAHRSRALLQRAEIFLRLGQYTECTKTLGQLPEQRRQDPQALVLRAEMAVREAQAILRSQAVADRESKAQEKYAAAMQILRGIEETADERAPVRSKATYLLGVCLMETGDTPGAIHEFFQARSTEADFPEVLAANLYEAELCRGLGQNDESLAAYCRALAVAGDPEHYNNPYVPLDELRRRTLDAYRQHLDARNYAWCDAMVQRLSPVFPLDRALQLSVDTGRAWARDLLAQSERLPAAQAAPLEKQARAVLCRVALACRRSAKLHFTDRSYPDDLWDSAIAYQEGHDYQAAVRMFQQYLKEEVRRRNPQGWTNLGEALLALDRPDEALSALNKCVDFYPRDAASFRARLLASRAYVDQGDMARAERLLRANLDGELLTPASKEWRDSLFALGELLYRTGRYDEAMRRLDEAVRRYPDSRPALHARYLLADSNRQLAKAESAKLAQDAVESTRIARSTRIRRFLEDALDGFRQTEDLLVRAQETSEPTPSDKALARNCGFAIGSLRFDLGQFDAAIKTYTQLANRQPDAPESLDAYLQIARAYHQLDNQAEARAALKQAQAALARMKPQMALQETTNRSRQEWEETLKE